MKTYLLGEKHRFYKANLHCHTNLTDGRLSPEEVKALYKAQGYSVVAFTDHDVLIPHPELKDEDFLPLNGMEFSVRNKDADRPGKNPCVHMNFIALEEDNVKTPLYHRTKHITSHAEENRARITFDDTLPDYERNYSIGMVNDAIRRARALGFFVTYNHPIWSFENAERLLQYENLNAIEVYNHSCNVIGYDEYTPGLYEHLCRSGKRLLPIAADDNHNKYDYGNKQCDSFGGYVMIEAEKLEYRSITRALEQGAYYASTGAVIHEIFVEEGVLTVKGENVERINVNYEYGAAQRKVSDEEPMTEGSFDFHKDRGWFRVSVFDRNGKFAMTRPFYPEEWLGK